jgi:hypothetical protein
MRPGGGGAGTAEGYPGAGGRPTVGGAGDTPQAGVIGRGGAGGGGPGSAGLAEGGGVGIPGGRGGSSDNAAPDYTTPQGAAKSFLAAVKARNTTQLAEAIALRAEYEASTDAHKQSFKAMRDENASAEEIDKLAQQFDGMEVTNMPTNARSSHTRNVVVGKEKDNKLITCTIYVRKEKDGWKVVDYSKLRVEITGVRTPKKKS